MIYLDGNSLGRLPAHTAQRLQAVIQHEWGEGLIQSWNLAGWLDAPLRIGDKIARLINAPLGSVWVGDSTSINLFKLLSAALKLRPDRKVILTEADNFPTDLYIAQGVAAWLGVTVQAVPSDQIHAHLNDNVAVLMLSQVNYRTGAMHDLPQVTQAAQQAGALVLWDLAHSAGAVDVDISSADLAVGCGYKYLNGGPGAPSFAYVHPQHLADLQHPLTGWLGHARPFAFEGDFEPAADITRLQVGTPAILGLAALEAGVDEFLDQNMQALRQKSLQLTEAFMQGVQQMQGLPFEIVTPQTAQRGSQVCLRHEHAYPICQALIAYGVVGDFRAPDILRFGFAPLCNTLEEVAAALKILADVWESGVWRQGQFQVRKAVT
jgi:kynureninase